MWGTKTPVFELRDLQILSALGRHRHFARAANECGISQPAFSARLKKFELDLGVPLVERGNRFQGFTPEGEIALKCAIEVLDAAEGLRQRIAESRGTVAGQLTIGTVPTALAFVSMLPQAMKVAHPHLSLQIKSATALLVQLGLEDRTFDAGISYLDGVLPPSLVATRLYDERYVLLAPRALAPQTSGSITWREASLLPLSVLTSDMQNRRIVEQVFQEIGVSANIVLEANVFSACLAQVQSGFAATIVPELLVRGLPAGDDVVSLALTEPEIRKPIGLIVTDRAPMLPAVKALRDIVEALLQ